MFVLKALFLLLVAIVPSGIAQIVQRRSPIIRFFADQNCRPATGLNPYYEFTDSTNFTTPSPKSYCVHRGAWLVEVNPALGGPSTNFSVSVGDGCVVCSSVGTSTRGVNIRRIGGPDLTQASIGLYREAYFRGEEKLINGWEYSFDATYSFSSVAFNSFSNWTWQLYYSPRFRGNSMCLRPNHSSEITVLTPHTVNVGSIRLGCRNATILLKSLATPLELLIVTLFFTATSVF